MAGEKAFYLFALKPLLPGGSLEAAPMFGIFIDDHQFAAGLEHARKFSHGRVDVDSVFETFGGVDEVEGIVSKRVLSEGAADGRKGWLCTGEHGQCQIQSDNFGVGILVDQDTGKAAFAATGVEGKLAVHVPEEAGDHLHVVDARVNRRGEVFFVTGRFLKALPDLGQSNDAGSLLRVPAPESILEPGKQS